MPAYLIRGFDGGYEAGVSDKRDYAEDPVYSHIEFRVIGRYRLELTLEHPRTTPVRGWRCRSRDLDMRFEPSRHFDAYSAGVDINRYG